MSCGSPPSRAAPGRPRWNLYTELGAVDDHNTYPINFNGRDSTQATGSRSWDGFCTIQSELDGACTQTAVTQFSPLDDPVHQPAQGRAAPAVRRQRVGRHRAVHLLPLGRLRERGRRLPAAAVRGGLGPRSVRGTVPDNQLRPNALERVNLRANLGANVSAERRPPGQRRLHLQRHPVRRERQQLPDHHRQRRGQRQSRRTSTAAGTSSPPSSSPSWNSQSVERFIGGLTGNWRPLSWLTTRATLGYDVTNRQDVQFWPTGQVADYLDQPRGQKYDNRFQISQTSVDLAATRPVQAVTEHRRPRRPSAASSSATSPAAPSPPGAGCRPAPRPSPAPGSTEARDTTVESRSRRELMSRRSSRSRSGSSSPAPSASTTTAPSARTSTPRSTPRPASPGCSRRSRSSTAGFLNTLRLRGAFGASRPAARHHRCAPLLQRRSPGRRGGAATTGITFGSLGNTDLKPERSGEFEVGLDAALLKDRVSVELTYFNKQHHGRADRSGNVAPSIGRLRVPVLQPGRGQEPRLRARHQHPDHRQPRASPGTSPSAARSTTTSWSSWARAWSRSSSASASSGTRRAIRSAGTGRGRSPASRTPTATASSSPTRSPSADDAVFRGRALPNKEASLNSASRCSTGESGWAPSSTTAAGTRSTTRSSPSAAPRCSTAAGWWTAPRRWRSRPSAQAVLNEAHRVGLLRARLVHQAARAVAHLLRPGRLGPALPGQPAEPHAGRRGTSGPSPTTAAWTRRSTPSPRTTSRPATSSRSRRCSTGPRASTSASETG